MILHEKRYLIKAMKRNIKYLFDLFFVYIIPHSSTPLLRLYPLDKCFRCCLPSLQSGLNWSWYVPTPYYNFAGNCNQHHTHIHIRSACAGAQKYSSCRMLWIWCWGCIAHHCWDKIAPDWCGFDLPFLPLPYGDAYAQTIGKCGKFRLCHDTGSAC